MAVSQAFVKFLEYCADTVPELDDLLAEKKGKELVIADVGLGTMPYADSLYSWLDKYSVPRIYAVDSFYAMIPESQLSKYFTAKPAQPISIVRSSIEDSEVLLSQYGVEYVDLFTIFNPNGGVKLPDITRLFELSRNSIVILACDGGKSSEYQGKIFSSELARDQGMKLLAKRFENPFSKEIRSELITGHGYSPVIIARAP